MVEILIFLRRIWGLRKRNHLISVILRILGLSSLFTITVDSIKLRFHPAAISSHLWEDCNKYSADLDLLNKYLKPGDIYVDAGANIGLYALIASKVVGNNGLIVAIEAHPETYGYLIDNISLNKANNVKPINTALGSKTGFVYFSNEKEDDVRHVLTQEKGINIPLTTLDILISHLKRIELLKIDVEGYEFEVLLGSERILSCVQCIYFESSDNQLKRYGRNSSELFDLLKQNGFRIFIIHPKVGNLLLPIPSKYRSVGVENLVAIKNLGIFIERTGYCISFSSEGT